MTALLFLCWLGLSAIALCCIAAVWQEYRSRKCPDYPPDDWTRL